MGFGVPSTDRTWPADAVYGLDMSIVSCQARRSALMPGDPVLAQDKLNARAVDEACRKLALALAAEESAGHDAAEAESKIDREIETATRLSSTDADVEALDSWLSSARRRATVARAAAESAWAETACCRAVLAAAEAGSAARRKAEASAVAACAEQKALDEVVRRAEPP